jgi:hypothetical protein
LLSGYIFGILITGAKTIASLFLVSMRTPNLVISSYIDKNVDGSLILATVIESRLILVNLRMSLHWRLLRSALSHRKKSHIAPEEDERTALEFARTSSEQLVALTVSHASLERHNKLPLTK